MRKTLKLTKANYYTRRSGIFKQLYIENRRFKERVFINIYVDPSIDKTVLEIPPMLIQPFENVLFMLLINFILLQN
jgi:LytS/YehU family sensor histidine kinase